MIEGRNDLNILYACTKLPKNNFKDMLSVKRPPELCRS